MKKKRSYVSLARRRQADETKGRILAAARELLESNGYAGMTIGAIAGAAKVSAQSVYATFRSKTGILRELLARSMFGVEYDEAVRQALSTDDPENRLRFVARIARQIHQAKGATLDALRGAQVVAPELARLEQWGDTLRYKRQKEVITLLADCGRLRKDLHFKQARDILWMFTGQDVYRMLVRERGWSPRHYEAWLGKTLVGTLLSASEQVHHQMQTDS